MYREHHSRYSLVPSLETLIYIHILSPAPFLEIGFCVFHTSAVNRQSLFYPGPRAQTPDVSFTAPHAASFVSAEGANDLAAEVKMLQERKHRHMEYITRP